MKIDKYDRQVRIWGTKGQKKLTFAKVAIIGCSGPSIQAAKNLILPGVGRVDIFDDKIIRVQDLSSSFFYEHESVGNLRGEQALRNLLQMNTDVQGEFRNISVQNLINNAYQHLKDYNVVVCGNLMEQENRSISIACWEMKVPVIFITTVGFFFHVRNQKEVHIVQSQNITGKKYYLRLHDPFEGLKSYVQSKQLPRIIAQLKENKQDPQTCKKLQKQFSKITYPVFLVESFLQLKNRNGEQPKPKQVIQLLSQWKQLVRQDPDIRSGINQAITRSFDLYQTSQNFLLSQQILQSSQPLTQSSPFIHIFLKAVKQFMSCHDNHLPQLIRLPDISTTTKDYLQLKQIYKLQHQTHKQQLKKTISNQFPEYKIDNQLLSEYMNNIDALQVVKMRPYYEEMQSPDTIESSINYLQDQKNLLVALRAYKLFQRDWKRSPTPDDYQQMLAGANKLCQTWKIDDLDVRFIRQICRFQGKSLISYDSMAGAIAGQESVKLITNCFTPMNNGYFFDGLKCKGYSITL